MALSQTERNKNWQSKNKEYNNYINTRSRCRGFIKNTATMDDLLELKLLIEEKILTLNEN